jgi:oligopeptidase A
MDFLNDLMEKAKVAALREHKEIAEYAKWHDGIETLEHWDIRYYLKQVKESKYAFSQEELAKYFSVPEVLAGSFAILKKLYSISFVEREGAELWSTDAKLLEVYKDGKNLTAGLCTDLNERPGGKSGGAWMNEMVLRRELQDGTIQLPVGVLVANFRSPSDGAPSLLSIDEVESTLLHELGHEAHLLLTTQGVRSVSGLNGVPVDGIELPSQFMENFCWQRESLNMLAHHYETGEKIPDELFEKVLASRTFGKAHEMVWLTGRALFDFRLHMEYDPTKENQVESIYQAVCDSVQPVSPFYTPWAPESFTHIFGGQFGHFAWYYSYPWALVLAAEVFAKFIRADGSIDWSVGRKLEEEVLSLGGSRPFMESVIKFLGHNPSVGPLLRQFGFNEQ